MPRVRPLLGRDGVGTGDKADLHIACSLCSACKRGARTDNNLYAEYIMRNARLDETQAGIKIAGRNINNLRYADAAAAAAAAKSLQSCQTLCDPIDGSPPGSSIPGILQARTLEWVAISFSNA